MRYFILFILILFPGLVLAADIFSIPSHDISVYLLSQLFGNVEGVLELGVGSTLLKGVLVNFNAAVLALGGIVVLYVLVVSTLNTAHEGEMLGKKWNSVWIPVRMCTGFALLLPVKANGYAIIQVFVMWVVLQGVGAADFLWNKGLDSLYAQGVPVFTPPSEVENSSAGVQSSASIIFTSLVCAKETAAQSGTNPWIKKQSDRWQFGVDKSTSDHSICGSVQRNPSTDPTSSKVNDALDNMVSSLSSTATKFINAYADQSTYSDKTQGIANEVSAAARTYASRVNQAYNSDLNPGNNSFDQAIQLAREGGWATAGSVFLNLAQVTNDYTSSSIAGPSTTAYGENESRISQIVPDYQLLSNELIAAMNVATPSDQQLNSVNDVMDFLVGNGLGAVASFFFNFLSMWQSAITGDMGTSVNPLIAIQAVGAVISQTVITMYTLFTVAIIALGGVSYAGQSALSAILTLGIGSTAAKGAWGMLIVFMGTMMTPILLAAGTLLGVGLTWAYYIPLVPYMVFTLAVLGWLILVVEAMVAGPLLAIGVLYPEGHDVVGQGQTGIMILASIFLRPPLMIVGYFTALLMTYVSVIFISVTMTPAIAVVFGQNIAGSYEFWKADTFWGGLGEFINLAGAPGFWIVSTIVIMIVFTLFLLVAINKSFSLIYVIPDKIMRWIGGPSEQSVSEQELQGVRGGVESYGGQHASRAGESVTGVAKQLASRGARQSGEEGEESEDPVGVGKT